MCFEDKEDIAKIVGSHAPEGAQAYEIQTSDGVPQILTDYETIGPVKEYCFIQYWG